MTRLSFRAFQVITFAGSLAFASVAAQAEEQLLVVDPALQTKILAHLPSVRPATPIKKTTDVQTIDNAGNFGKLMFVDQTVEYSTQENGLLEVSRLVKFRSADSNGVSHGVSLCGLVNLASESSSKNTLESASAVPVGKIFVPFGVRSTVDTGSKIRLKAFDTSAKVLCSPEPGAEFTFHLETEVQIKRSGLFGRTINTTWVDDNSCKVAAQAIPASQFGAQLRGDSLLVTCDRARNSNPKVEVQYLYLRDSAIFVPAAESSDVQKSKLEYSAVEY